MGKLADFVLGKEQPSPIDLAADAAVHRARFHSSTLEDIVLSAEIQAGGSVRGAFAVPAVYRAVQILSDLVASLPLYAYDGGRHSGSRLVGLPDRKDVQPGVVVSPDPFMSRDQWVRNVITSLAVRGNAYLFGSMYVEGHPTRIQVLNPDDISVSWADQARTRRQYRWGADLELPDYTLRHLTLNLLPGALKGLGPIDAIAATIKGQIEADTWARDLFTSAGMPSGKLMHPGKLDYEDAMNLAAQWDEAHMGNRLTAVLSGGMDFEPISLSPEAAQFLQTRSFGVAEIARAFGIPSHLLNAATGVAGASGSSMTYTNVRDTWVELWGLTAKPVYADRIAEAFSSFLPRGSSVQFDAAELMRPGVQQRFDSYAVALSNSFMTVDEVRAAEGLPPSPELEAEKAEKRAIAEQIAGGQPNDDDTDETQPTGAATANAE